jgi:hypothetical protein
MVVFYQYDVFACNRVDSGDGIETEGGRLMTGNSYQVIGIGEMVNGGMVNGGMVNG